MLQRATLAFAALFAMTTWAAAYLDPGTGSLALQMLIAGALTAAASIKIFWARLKDIVRRVIGGHTPTETKTEN